MNRHNPKLNRLLTKTGEVIAQIILILITVAVTCIVIFGLGRLAKLLN